MKTYIRNGVEMRKHYKTSTFITKDGKTIERDYTDHSDGDKLKTYTPKVSTDDDGRRYFSLKKFGKTYVDELVADCYSSPKPNDGKDYVLIHKDGNNSNDHFMNLEWKERSKAFTSIPAKTDKSVKLTHGIRANRDGTIYQHGKERTVESITYDADTNLFVPIWPLISYSVKNKWERENDIHISPDKIMDTAGYVTGNPKSFPDPVILHVDGDYMNFDSSNLEWVDKKDPRYIDYYNKTVDVMNELGKKKNKGVWPDFMSHKHI